MSLVAYLINIHCMKSTFSSYKEPNNLYIYVEIEQPIFSNQIFQKVAGMPHEGIIVQVYDKWPKY